LAKEGKIELTKETTKHNKIDLPDTSGAREEGAGSMWIRSAR
jgi:hypothetical protein